MSGFGLPNRDVGFARAGILRRGFSAIGGGEPAGSIFEQYNLTVYADYDPSKGVFQESGGETEVASDGDPVGLIQDQSGNGLDITQATGTAKPAWHSNQFNGKPVIRHASGDILKAALASDWKLLHDGTKEFSAYIVWKVPTINASMAILDTGGVASADTGFVVRLGSNRNVLSSIAKGAGGGDYEAEASAIAPAVSDDIIHVTAVRMTASELDLGNDGDWGGRDSVVPDGTPSASDPTSALTVGGRHENVWNLIGDWARIVIVEGTVSDEAHQAVKAHLAEEYGSGSSRFFEAPTVVHHDASGADHNAFPGICVAPNGDLVVAYRKGASHNSTDGVIALKRSGDKGATWGAEETLLSDASWDYRAASLTTLSNGTIMMAVGRRDSSGNSGTDSLTVITSTDNGVTWSSEVVVSTGYTNYVREGGAVLELADGDLLYPFYGVTTGSSDTRAAVARSQDGGASWSFLSELVVSSSSPVEPGLVQLPNGDVIALIRFNGTDVIGGRRSTDNGATWSVITIGVSADGRCNPILLSSGEVVDIQRQRSLPGEPSQILYSLDGDSWQLGHYFPGSPNFTNGEMTYAQMDQGADGTIYVLYAMEATPAGSSSSISDIMLSKSPAP